MKDQRGSWYLLTGILLGLIIGLAYAWLVQPVEYIDSTPVTLRQDYKDHYRLMIAAAYQANGDLVRAKARLEKLNGNNAILALEEQIKRIQAGAGSAGDAYLLQLLAEALNQGILSPDPPGPPGSSTQAANITTYP